MAQFRLSLYSIFNITDDLEMAALKTKKVRNQLRLVKDKSDETTQKLEQAYKELDRIRSELNDNGVDHRSKSLILQTEDGSAMNMFKKWWNRNRNKIKKYRKIYVL